MQFIINILADIKRKPPLCETISEGSRDARAVNVAFCLRLPAMTLKCQSTLCQDVSLSLKAIKQEVHRHNV